MLRPFGVSLLLASGLAITAGPALAVETVVTQVDKRRLKGGVRRSGNHPLDTVQLHTYIGCMATPSRS
jgi:hypothetical protein